PALIIHFLFLCRPPPSSTLFPYTTLFRSVLTCSPGSWRGGTPTFVLWAWIRNGRVIEGASGRTRRLVAADRGKHIACRVLAANSSGAARATSRARLVRAAP